MIKPKTIKNPFDAPAMPSSILELVADNIMEAWKRMTISMRKTESSFVAFAEALGPLIDQEEARKRVLGWQGIWLWD
jgi:hypothetical protein